MGRGWRVVVRGRDEKMLDRLDEQLWVFPKESFLPHGRAGGPRDADQPVLLTTAADRPNGAECVVSVDGADFGDDELSDLPRVCVVFDGKNPAAVKTAREQWRRITGAGHVAKYWSQDSGSWQLKAESGG